MCESSLINLLSFKKENGESLCELTNIVNGHASNREASSPAAISTMARTVESFLQECAYEERDIEPISQNYRIVLINIKKLYPRCICADGTADITKVRESVRGIWHIGFRKASQVQYIFAIYEGRVVGVFHVTRAPLKLSDERNNGFRDFPTFPEDLRRINRFQCIAPTLAEAQRKLSEDEYAEMIASFQPDPENNGSLEKQYANFQRRIYFVVDSDDIPGEILSFMNCYPTKDGSQDFIRKGYAQYGGQIFVGNFE